MAGADDKPSRSAATIVAIHFMAQRSRIAAAASTVPLVWR
jgi:hypothetical protein